MLSIYVKFIASELTPKLVSGKYEITEGSTVRELIALCEQNCGAAIPEDNFRYMYPLFNGKPVRQNDKLTQDGTLHLCRIIMGG